MKTSPGCMRMVPIVSFAFCAFVSRTAAYSGPMTVIPQGNEIIDAGQCQASSKRLVMHIEAAAMARLSKTTECSAYGNPSKPTPGACFTDDMGRPMKKYLYVRQNYGNMAGKGTPFDVDFYRNNRQICLRVELDNNSGPSYPWIEFTPGNPSDSSVNALFTAGVVRNKTKKHEKITMLSDRGPVVHGANSYIEVMVNSYAKNPDTNLPIPQQSLNIALLIHESPDIDFPIILDPQLHGSGH